jgi:hypothetical protein
MFFDSNIYFEEYCLQTSWQSTMTTKEANNNMCFDSNIYFEEYCLQTS